MTPEQDPRYLTLRDQFAMAALTGILSIPGASRGVSADKWFETLADTCYQYADAMMQEREK